MKKLNLFYILFIVSLVSVLTYIGCSKEQENLVNAPELGIHPSGWADTASTDFHGKYIYDNNAWNLQQCQSCHGSDYAGGNTGSNCNTCHTASGGPQNCRLCHGGNSGHAYPPKALNGETRVSYAGVGVHVNHMDSTKYSAKVECNECHTLISSFSDPNHIDINTPGVADINFGTLAKTCLLYTSPSPRD